MCDLDILNPVNYVTPKGWGKMYDFDNVFGIKTGSKKSGSSSPDIKIADPVAAPKMPTILDAQKAGDDEKKRMAALAGQTIKTTSRGLGDSAFTTKKTLLGQ